jgi:hypothetical protein
LWHRKFFCGIATFLCGIAIFLCGIAIFLCGIANNWLSAAVALSIEALAPALSEAEGACPQPSRRSLVAGRAEPALTPAAPVNASRTDAKPALAGDMPGDSRSGRVQRVSFSGGFMVSKGFQ